MGLINVVPLPIFSLYLVLLLSTFHVKSAILLQRSTYIVHMDKSSMPKVFTSPEKWYSSIIDSLKSGNHTPSLIYTYDNALHGFSASLSTNEVEALRKFPGFVSAYNVKKSATIDTTHTPEYLSLNPFADLWPTSSFGKDIIIGVLDSGLWPESLSFEDYGISTSAAAGVLDGPYSKWKGSCEGGQEFNVSMCNAKLIGIRFFNNGVTASTSKQIIDSARDTLGHGTYVSSIAAGNYVSGVSYFGYADGTAKGVAPHARLAMYKVIWEEGIDPSDVLAGLNQAIRDGVDVISISMGFNYVSLDHDPIAIASFAAMEKGIVVATSAGNAGPGFGTLHNGIPWVITVSSGTVDRWFAGTLTLGNGLSITGWSLFAGITFPKNLTLVYNKTLAACNSSQLLSEAPFGIILCDMGDIHNQTNAIIDSKVPGAIFIYPIPSLVHMKENSCPCVVIRPADALMVINYVESNTSPFVCLKFKETFFGTKPAPVVAVTASRGPSRSCPSILKPDIMAPGSLVLGAWVPKKEVARMRSTYRLYSDYNIETGTSAACPHVAGVAALLKGAHPNWSAAAIRSAIMTTANTTDNTRKPIRDLGKGSQLASPLAMGAGHIDPNQALDPGLIYDITPQDYVNLLCFMKFNQSQILSITGSRIYNCWNPSPTLNYPSFIAFYSDSITVTTKKFLRIATNVGKDYATYKAVVTAPEHTVVTVSPETLVFRKQNENQSYTMTIQYKGNENGTVLFGTLDWVEENGKYRVKSPIVISPLLSS